MVMLNTEREAQVLKEQIEAGEMTLYQAASGQSVAPDAKQNLGEIGWIGKGKTKPQLDEVIFALQPAEIGGPVEAGGLWHLVSVQDIRDAQYSDLAEEATRKFVQRRYIHEQLDDYVVALRKNDFPVQVYEDELIRLAQQEVEMVKTLAAQSENPSSVTRKRIQEMQKLINP
jgi:parvulin-like peptidyl-prolyl isomerase